MAVDIKNVIIQKISEFDKEIDTSEGSVIRDLLINPLVPILDSYVKDHTSLLNILSKSDTSGMSTDMVDGIAATFLTSRSVGSYATGYIQLYFQQPKAINIPKGTSLVSISDGVTLEFTTSTDYSMSKSRMSENIINFPYYTSGKIKVTATSFGEPYNLPQGTLFKFTNAVTVTPEKVMAAENFTGGISEESNEDLFTRVVKSVKGNSLSSPLAIKDRIASIAPSVTSVEVVGAKHPLMVRDLTLAVDANVNYRLEDFSYTYSGIRDSYDKQHIALGGNFTNINENSEIQLPSITGWVNELSTIQYKGLWDKYDSNYAAQDQHVIIREFFGDLLGPADQGSIALVLASGQWQLHDGLNPSNSLFYVDEVGLSDNKLRLGMTQDINDIKANVSLGVSQINAIWDLLQDPQEEIRKNAADTIRGWVAPHAFNNMSPIFHTPISQHNGITIDVDVSTTDSTELGEISYITVLRNSEVFVPHDGYGIAWRKQPEFLLRMQKNEYTLDSQREADLKTFSEQYSAPNMGTPESYLGQIKDHPELWKYNVYLVDNDILQEEVWVGYDQIWDQTSGKNQFLQAAKVWIEPNKEYHVKIKIHSNMGTNCWIHPKEEIIDYANAAPAINRGQTYSKYLPQSGYKNTNVYGTETLNSSRGHFGLGVGETRNCEWYFDNLIIKSFLENYPAHLFRLKADPMYFEPTKSAAISYFGVGYDPINYALDGSGHSKTTISVLNTSTPLESWETLDTHTHTKTIDDARIDQELTCTLSPIMNYIDEEGYVNVAAYANNVGAGYENDLEHMIRSYYISMDNLRSSSVHRGNAVDIYCHEPSRIKRGTTSVMYFDGTPVRLSTIPDLSYALAITSILKEGSMPLDISDYTISTVDAGVMYSGKSGQLLAFSDQTSCNASIEYLYWENGPTIDQSINSEDDRYPAADIMIKAMPLTIVTIDSLKYAGGLLVADMRIKIKDYINSLAEITFDKSDIVNVLYENNATYVDLDMTITIKEYDTTGKINTYELTSSRCTISASLSRFYTDVTELYGVTQQ